MFFQKKKRLLAKPDFDNLPQHIGFIMDGNGRWAKRRGLPRSAGHRAGAKTFRDMVRYCKDIGIKNMTVYAFSTENWKRPKEEVEAIMDLLRSYLKDAFDHREEEVRCLILGDTAPLAPDIVALIKKLEDESRDCKQMTLNIALNYGGRAEITHAVRELAGQVQRGELAPGEITEDTISAHLYTAGQPDPDLIIRPSGEYRTSNFLLWQSAYSELVFMDVLWPDFTRRDLDRAILEYQNRDRRFGGV
ncbi:isoprenyl transferase [bacterium 210820-DFI.6.52]|uniref:Isoprenyl transferase n=2 Tax=Clostridia TaxID=186801 RepID=A0AAQ1MBM8_9FIRM|nr:MULTISPECIES: isoprenyl transferase [Eubacteriales]MCB5941069.1 isoprenyl transferase [bacterium 210820-DFI.6.52]ERI99058.1 di-trans,poly-cis-decaprenylcistransferase [Clostridium sp. ATCC 29733]MZL68729.1 isoprenyl transferase [Bittarella massiliensis (ex Durand et al. 2017)]MZL81714.1 isoprenyl transferase [Bittarella massiliensis (ex Durand et al. 2017)]SHF70078.1 undecaprenyl diphosphate synthase [Bittarella massiliensis (ex Durand et al. 2017)]